MPAISVLMKPSSGMCNMKCDYCFYCDEATKRNQGNYGFMSEATLKNVIRRTLLQTDGAAAYAFQGGEPTLRGLDFFRQLMIYEKQYNKNGVRITNALQTNGLALNEEWCRFFQENHFLVGISIDGTKALHDLHRHTKAGGPTYDRILQATRLMDRYQVDYNILTVVNRQVAENITEIYENYRRNGWHYQQYIACLDPLGEPHGQSEYALTPDLYGQFLIRLFELWYEDVRKGNPPYIRSFENYLGLLLGYPPEACDQRGCCGIQYVVEADGSVYPCDFYMLDDYCLGSFNQDRLPALDTKRREIGFIEKSLKLDPACKTCPYYQICRGGCQRQRDPMRNEAGGNSEYYKNYFCESYRMFFDACLDRLVKVAEEIRRR